jgi:hypothetical protein
VNKNNSGVSNNDDQWTSNWYDPNGGMNNEYRDNDNMIDVPPVRGNDSIKKCSACTYDNVSSNTTCEMCGTLL